MADASEDKKPNPTDKVVASLEKEIGGLKKEVASLAAQVEKLAMSLVEYKKNGDPQTKVIVEDLKKQVTVVAGRLGINANQPARGRGFQVRAPGPITNVTRPITRR